MRATANSQVSIEELKLCHPTENGEKWEIRQNFNFKCFAKLNVSMMYKTVSPCRLKPFPPATYSTIKIFGILVYFAWLLFQPRKLSNSARKYVYAYINQLHRLINRGMHNAQCMACQYPIIYLKMLNRKHNKIKRNKKWERGSSRRHMTW